MRSIILNRQDAKGYDAANDSQAPPPTVASTIGRHMQDPSQSLYILPAVSSGLNLERFFFVHPNPSVPLVQKLSTPLTVYQDLFSTSNKSLLSIWVGSVSRFTPQIRNASC